MEKLNERQMRSISAGSISAFGWAVISALVSFVGGFLDGYTRPYKCR